MFLLFLKKELSDFLKNKLFVCFFVVFLGYPFVLHKAIETYNDLTALLQSNLFFYLLFPEFLFCCLYMSDSCNKDLQTGGMLFLVNLKAPLGVFVIAKTFVVLFMGVFFSIVNHIFFSDIFSFLDVVILLFILLSCLVMSFAISLFVHGSDAISFGVISVLCGLQISLFQKYGVFHIQVCVPLIQLILFTCLLRYIYKSRRFRFSL